MRQALFNSLQSIIPEANVLDLFAGSGSLGFEALSRGASRVVFVERAKSVCKLIEKNAVQLKVLDRVEIISESVDQAWKRVERFAPFGLVMADPPYSEGWEEKLIHAFPWQKLLTADGFYSLEWGTQKSRVQELPDHFETSSEVGSGLLVKVREKNYGDSVLTTYRRTSEAAPVQESVPEAEGDPT